MAAAAAMSMVATMISVVAGPMVPASATSPEDMRSVTAAKNADGRLEVFAHTGRGIFRNRQQGGEFSWSGWKKIGGDLLDGHRLSKVSVELNRDGGLELFVVDSDNLTVYHTWQNPPGGPTWSSWNSLGSFVRQYAGARNVTVAANQDGRLEVFGTDGIDVWHKWQGNPGVWSNWVMLPHKDQWFFGGDVAVQQQGNGSLALVTTSTGLYQQTLTIKQLCPNCGWQSSWTHVDWNHPTTGVTLAANDDERLEIFGTRYASDLAGTLWHSWQGSPDGSFSIYHEMPGSDDQLVAPNADVAVANGLDGRLEVFTTTQASSVGYGKVLRWYQNCTGCWTGPVEMPGASNLRESLDVMANADGRLELFGFTRDGKVVHAWETTSGGSWSSFTELDDGQQIHHVYGDASGWHSYYTGIQVSGMVSAADRDNQGNPLVSAVDDNILQFVFRNLGLNTWGRTTWNARVATYISAVEMPGDLSPQTMAVINGRLHQILPGSSVAGDTGIAVTGPISATYVGGTWPQVFTVKNGLLHQIWGDSTGWHIASLGITASGPISAVYMSGTWANVYTVKNGTLHHVYGDSTGWHIANTGVAVDGPISSANMGGGWAQTMTIKNGTLHQIYGDSTGWHIANTGIPASGRISAVNTGRGWPDVIMAH